MEISTDPHLFLNQTASVLLAAAVVELFPQAQLQGGCGTSKYFYYDFVLPFPCTPDSLPLIEERMRLIAREKREVRSTEMMPSNAAALMRHRRQYLLAEQLLLLRQSTVPMVQIGDFTIPCSDSIAENFVVPLLKILEYFDLEKKSIRIIGAAAQDKDTLKKIGKEPTPGYRSHLKLAADMALFCPAEEEGLWMWRPKGEQLRHLLLTHWREEMVRKNFNLISQSGQNFLLSHWKYFSRFHTSKLAELGWAANPEFNNLSDGLLSPKACFGDRAHLFCTEEKLLEECISSLRFILKIPKILGFEFEIVLSISSQGAQKAKAKKGAILRQALEENGLDYSVEKQYRFGTLASIDIRFTDSLERKWTGPSVSFPDIAHPPDKSCVLAISLFGSLERICALLLEKNEGWLPFWLAPEQVRILTASHQLGAFAKEIEEALRTQGIRMTIEAGEEKLKTRLYQAVVEKVPYVLLLGEIEEKTKTIALRVYGECEEQRLSLGELSARLRKIGMVSGNTEFKN